MGKSVVWLPFAYILCLPALNLLHTVASLYSVLHLLLEVFCVICIPGLQVIERFVLVFFFLSKELSQKNLYSISAQSSPILSFPANV